MTNDEKQINDILKEADAHCVALNELIKKAAALNVALTVKDYDASHLARLFLWTTGQTADKDGVEPKLVQWRAELVKIQREQIGIKREQPAQG